MSREQQIRYEGEVKLREEMINVRRVSKVVKGGRIFSFAALSVVGDEQGSVGIGCGKAREVSVAVNKSKEDARKNMVKINMNGNTILYPVIGRHGSARVVLRPAAEGTGIIAGGTMRAVFEALGVENILAKIIGTSNPINVARATIEALSNMQDKRFIANKRSRSIHDL